MTPTPNRRTIPRLSGTGRAWVCETRSIRFADWGGLADVTLRGHGITDGNETVWLNSRTEAVLAAKVHNLIHGHDDDVPQVA